MAIFFPTIMCKMPLTNQYMSNATDARYGADLLISYYITNSKSVDIVVEIRHRMHKYAFVMTANRSTS